MAGRVIRFLPRQVLAGNASGFGEKDVYSPVFEVTNSDTLLVETQVYSADPATAELVVSIEETSDPTLGDNTSTELGTASVTASAGVGRAKATLDNPLRFVRAKITLDQAATVTVGIEGLGRST